MHDRDSYRVWFKLLYIHVHKVDKLYNSVYEAILIVNRSGALLLTG